MWPEGNGCADGSSTGRIGDDVYILRVRLGLRLRLRVMPRSGGRMMCSPSRYVRGGLPIALCFEVDSS